MKNILYNTTRQWNCGDEFIMAGTRNLISELIPLHNSIVFDRNPDLIPLSSGGHSRRISNSWSLQNFNFDYYVAAGTPEWGGPRNSSVTKFVYENKIPSIFLGIGTANAVDQWTGKILSNSLSVICRDTAALSRVKNHHPDAICLHCPSIFCTESTSKHSLQNIGIVFQSDAQQWQKISTKQKTLLIETINRLSANYNVSLICHYHKELYEAKKLFPHLDIYYSYNYSDYFDIYKKFDLTISTRLHGCFCSLACGVPTIMPSGLSGRCKGAVNESPLVIQKPFEEIDPDTVDVKKISSEMMIYKQTIKKDYLKKLSGLIEP